LHRKHINLNAWDFDTVKPLADGSAKLGGYPTGTAVNQKTIAIYKTEVPSGRDITGLQINFYAQGF